MQRKQKEKIRFEMLSLRDSMSSLEISSKSSLICKKLMEHPEINSSKAIAVYFPIRNEVDIKQFVSWCLNQGKTVLLPVSKTNYLDFCQIKSLDDLVEGNFGILEPKDKTPFIGEIDTILVPGVCFDEKMHRLGYGKGYYDRHLSNSSSYTIGIGYEFQIVSELPIENFDIPLDEILTDTRSISKHY